MNLILRFIYLFLLSLSIAGLSGCHLIPFWPEGEDDEIGHDESTIYVPPGEPLIRSGLTLQVGVMASGSTAVATELKSVDLNGEILMPLIGAIQ